ncbi:hypothetical protein ZHAS_00002612 [Anopheles sinensis]|uniref:Fibrinogen C-terminal domain-containing protein n=1 Tax=Anopheles sinensis TaxID=74873 RepID=A0A084VCL9_ANOSI|nr:hypothetical protein ZHAS_00002612 [Anopheles sinensis]
MAVDGNELQQLMSKLEALKDKLQEVEYSMKNSIKETEQRLEKNFAKLEKDMKHSYKQVDDAMKERDATLQTTLSKLETNMKTMNNSLQGAMRQVVQNVQPGEENNVAKCMVNGSTVTEQNNKTQVDHFEHPIYSCRQMANISDKYLFRSGEDSKPFEVLCEQAKFDGGWTVIQRRYEGSVDFYRNWTEYRNGFGNVDGEFWLGLEYMHQITNNRSHELIVEVMDFEGNNGYAKYDEFEIGSEAEFYALKKLGAYSGTAGDSMSFSRNKNFSTFDQNNDQTGKTCAKDSIGAWWYYGCTQTNLNGRRRYARNDGTLMSWYHLKEDWRGLSFSRMMIRDIID